MLLHDMRAWKPAQPLNAVNIMRVASDVKLWLLRRRMQVHGAVSALSASTVIPQSANHTQSVAKLIVTDRDQVGNAGMLVELRR
jgi:hypothetical protein